MSSRMLHTVAAVNYYKICSGWDDGLSLAVHLIFSFSRLGASNILEHYYTLVVVK